MIRKNYSLASEIRREETKRQSKIQNRQKYNHAFEKLKNVDPISIYKKIERLKNSPDKDINSIKYLKTLQKDWDFIIKHDLHKDKVKPFLESVEKNRKQQEVLRNKLWGLKSVYFNPELNPLGKVPSGMENHTIPLKKHNTQHYDPDPLINELHITPPEGEAPRFYKQVYNTGRSQITTIESEAKRTKY